MIYHLRYWWHVSKRLVRWPFCRWARCCVTIDEYIAGIERDPEMRRLLAEARQEMRQILNVRHT